MFWSVTPFAGQPITGFVDGFGNDAMFSSPTDLTFDLDNNLIVVDSSNHKIRKISLTRTYVACLRTPTVHVFVC